MTIITFNRLINTKCYDVDSGFLTLGRVEWIDYKNSWMFQSSGRNWYSEDELETIFNWIKKNRGNPNPD